MESCKRCSRSLKNFTATIYDIKGNIKEQICEICHDLENIEAFKKGVMNTKTMILASMAKYYWTENLDGLDHLRPEIRELYLQNHSVMKKAWEVTDELQILVGEFEDKHWIPYLKKYWNDSTSRGHILELEDFNVMMWGSAGRVLITLENGKDTYKTFTMIFSDYVATEEDIKLYGDMKQRGGIQGFECTRKLAVDMMKQLINQKKLKFKVKNSVTMAGL